MRTPLGELAEFINGVAFKASDWGPSGSRIVRIQNLTDPSRQFNRTERQVADRFHARPGDLLVSWSATLGVFRWAGPDTALVNQHIFRVVPNASLVDHDYLRHVLAGALRDMARHAHGATMRHVTREQFLGTSVFLPSLNEQRRIARILDKAETLRTKRQHFTETVKEASKAAVPTDATRRVELGDVLERVESGRSPVCEARPAQSGEWGVLKLGAVSSGEFRPSENKATRRDSEVDPRHAVAVGDVLMARKNTLELLGSSVYVAHTPPRLLMPDLMFRLVPSPSAPITARYLQAALAASEARAQIRRLAGGSAGSMPNISKGRLLSVSIGLPTLGAQKQFDETSRAADRMLDVSRRLFAELDALFGSLQHRAFAGEL